MKRDPSIHIRLSHFTKVWAEAGLDTSEVIQFFEACRKASCDNRSITITNDKLKKDASRMVTSNKGDTALLAEVIYSVRIKKKHRGVSKIKEGDRDWLQLKQLTKLINEFCTSFDIEKRSGYISYVTLAFSKISSMHSYLTKFINMYEAICNEYEASLILKEDDSPDKTLAIHNDYVELVGSKTGIVEKFLDKPSKMLCFFKIKKKCEELNIEPEVWIDAQFDALGYCGGLPSPENMAGDKALERLNKYMFENNITTNKVNKKTNSNNFWDKLKKYGTDE